MVLSEISTMTHYMYMLLGFLNSYKGAASFTFVLVLYESCPEYFSKLLHHVLAVYVLLQQGSRVIFLDYIRLCDKNYLFCILSLTFLKSWSHYQWLCYPPCKLLWLLASFRNLVFLLVLPFVCIYNCMLAYVWSLPLATLLQSVTLLICSDANARTVY